MEEAEGVVGAVADLEKAMNEQDFYIPGEFRCPVCDFVCIKSIINPTTGEVGRAFADTVENCPNDGARLRPVRWDTACNEAREQAAKFATDNRRLVEEITRDRPALQSAVRLLEEKVVPRPCDEEGVAGCARCNTNYLVARVKKLLSLVGN